MHYLFEWYYIIEYLQLCLKYCYYLVIYCMLIFSMYCLQSDFLLLMYMHIL